MITTVATNSLIIKKIPQQQKMCNKYKKNQLNVAKSTSCAIYLLEVDDNQSPKYNNPNKGGLLCLD